MICVICLADEISDTRITLACQHTFHRQCISRWYMTSVSCPCCRSLEVSDDVDIPIYTSSLMVAAQHGDILRITNLLDEGIPVDEEDFQGITPLSYAIVNDWTVAAKILIAAGADINHRDKYGHTILITHVSAGRHKMVPFLLANGADASIVDPLGDTALEIAAFVGNVKALTLLLDHGCPQAQKEIALHMACRTDSLSCICALLNYGVDPACVVAGSTAQAKIAINAYRRRP